MINKAAIYDPYLDTLGGGERYCLTIAEILLKNNYQVDLFWSGDPSLISKAEERFSLDLKGIKIIPDIFSVIPEKLDLSEDEESIPDVNRTFDIPQKIKSKIEKNFKKFSQSSQYDIIFYLGDGSVPFLFGKQNYLHDVFYVGFKTSIFNI